jgi:hypothetical protein
LLRRCDGHGDAVEMAWDTGNDGRVDPDDDRAGAVVKPLTANARNKAMHPEDGARWGDRI